MKKLLIIILLLFSVSIQAQYLQPPRLNPAKGYTWTGTQMFYNILPTTTRLYNFGGSLNYWLSTYTQNLYADTVKSDIVLSRDVVIDSTLLVKGNLTTYNILPFANSTYNIGNSTTAWKDAYIDGYVYLAGNATTDGSWRFYANLSGDMIFEYRVSGSWVEKSRITK